MRWGGIVLCAALAACATAPPGPHPYRAGVAKVKITPETFGWLTGYGNRNRPADGVAQDLYARTSRRSRCSRRAATSRGGTASSAGRWRAAR